jgi:hypothetical protein
VCDVNRQLARNSPGDGTVVAGMGNSSIMWTALRVLADQEHDWRREVRALARGTQTSSSTGTSTKAKKVSSAR